jgi:hypothetical protein
MRTPNPIKVHTMALNIAQAAEAASVNRSTVLRAIKSGKITGTRDEHGAWWVEPLELFRVFPPAESKPKTGPEPAQGEFRLRADLAEARIEHLKSVLNDMREAEMALPGRTPGLSGAATKQPRRWWWRREG